MALDLPAQHPEKMADTLRQAWEGSAPEDNTIIQEFTGLARR